MHNALWEQASHLRLKAARAALLFAALLGMALASPLAQAQTFTVVYNFLGLPNGQEPIAGLIADSSGNLYGTTLVGGSSGGYGTVFKVDAKGTETLLHSFDRTDGYVVYAGVLRDKAGNLYGTTNEGGSSDLGVVYKLSETGKLTVLHNFTGGGTDGCLPYGGVIMDAMGNLYGTTPLCGGGYGMVWRLSPKGKFTVLHNFASGAKDGAGPELGNLLMDANGNIYGVTTVGGSANSGVVYKLSKSGKLRVLYSFAGSTKDGCYPEGTLAMDASGSLYGTTNSCGSAGDGIVWKLTKSGKETVLHNFAAGSSDGSNPYAGVILDAKGNLYGTTANGGGQNDGVVYELSKGGTFSLLHTFAGSDGSSPYCGLLRNAKGNLYGTTTSGGSSGDGVVWERTP